MWIELIKGLDRLAEFRPPASSDAILACEQALGNRLHPDLTALLRETDGVFADIYMPFDPLLFFADAGSGDRFGFVVQPPDRSEIFVWDHEDDSRRCVSHGLSDYLTGWLSGRLSI